MVISCNIFGVATSPNVADKSTSFNGNFNGMNLNMWSCPSLLIFGIVLLDLRSTKRALFEVLSTKSSTKRRKKRGTPKALNPILRALSYPIRQPYSPAYDFSVSDEQKAVFLVRLRFGLFRVRFMCAGDWPTVTGCPVSKPGNNCANGRLGLLEPWFVMTHTIWTTQEVTVFMSDRTGTVVSDGIRLFEELPHCQWKPERLCKKKEKCHTVESGKNVTFFEQLFCFYQLVLVVWNTFGAKFKLPFISWVKQNWHFLWQ